MTYDERFMEMAVRLATDNVTSSHGGPFGCVIVRDGQVIGTGVNEVTAHYDPSAHAEVQAIRAACSRLQSFQLTGCEVYASCEPCPMCFGALYWARPAAIYFGSTKEDAASIGFDDAFIYEELDRPMEKRSIPMIRKVTAATGEPFQAWTRSAAKKEY
ncbi:nucleoside deaminase [Paenibacillus aurantius]|uniref:Nucleoside deaminase n=1 Tax=Paenibacillus aurantius TaxID=2918900 RepID=A0AA96RGF3_9BACL|nr:nucleoside deaminase [Paenibacillus aurantius]WNQ12476.1 nucleoside deaminase [Paenibacillus aurantius]